MTVTSGVPENPLIDDKLAGERLRGRVEHWKQVTVIQMHFNDLCMRIRLVELTAVGTLIAAAAVAADKTVKLKVPLGPISSIDLSDVLLIVGLLITATLWIIDTQYYGRLLIASVKYGENIEPDLMRDLSSGNVGVTQFLSKEVSRLRSVMSSSMFYIAVILVITGFLAFDYFRT